MALDPLTASIVGGGVGSALGGFLRAFLSGTKLDPKVAKALDELAGKLSALTDALNRHVLEDKQLAQRVEELAEASGPNGGAL